MRIDIRNLKREPLFSVEVDARNPSTVVKPPDGAGLEVFLEWDQAMDDRGYLRHCPICGCRELFVRKDFPQVTGFVIVALAGVLAMILFGLRYILSAIIVLATVALIDFLIYLLTGKCLVCYRCRSEFRDLPIRPGHPGWELAIGEKYREAPAPSAAESNATPDQRP